MTDPRMVVWKALAQKHGIRSSVAIPICQPGGRPKAILSLYSRLPGGFTSCDQRAFVAQLQAILVFAITQIESQQGT
ncbi:GAF domain-containing protein, partial [Streptomyces brasiliscabiei]|uniref:GAF domain-containing protein n=1 Tax=Streptomyces brasiliscabiei TaxID=2736302 RepID=UPI0030151833